MYHFQPLSTKFSDLDFSAARSAAAHGDAKSLIFRPCDGEKSCIGSPYDRFEDGSGAYSLR